MGDMADLISDYAYIDEYEDYEPTWQDASGSFYDIRDMELSYLANIIKKARRERKEVPDEILKEYLLRQNGF